MSTSLPDFVDPWRAADSHATFAGCLPLSGLPRLVDLLVDTSGEVAFRLEFSRDQEHRAIVLGAVQALLLLRCQRCLQAVAHQVDARLALAAVPNIAAAQAVPERYDPLIADEGLIRPRDLVEDELLLDLPQIPAHGPELCSVVAEQAAQPDRENPFAVLAEWKRK
jgi:uncharacterized protein